jgi:cyclohexyl-isocyanide hydratase
VCALTRRIADDRGFQIEMANVSDSLTGLDMIFLPGGYGTRTLQHDAKFVEWLRTGEGAKLKVSVCTGALLLGAAGFLKGRRATTHPGAYAELEPYCASVVRERIVDEGDVITGGGVSSSIDLGLHVVQRLAGEKARDRIAAQMDYPYRWHKDVQPA